MVTGGGWRGEGALYTIYVRLLYRYGIFILIVEDWQNFVLKKYEFPCKKIKIFWSGVKRKEHGLNSE